MTDEPTPDLLDRWSKAPRAEAIVAMSDSDLADCYAAMKHHAAAAASTLDLKTKRGDPTDAARNALMHYVSAATMCERVSAARDRGTQWTPAPPILTFDSARETLAALANLLDLSHDLYRSVGWGTDPEVDDAMSALDDIHDHDVIEDTR